MLLFITLNGKTTNKISYQKEITPFFYLFEGSFFLFFRDLASLLKSEATKKETIKANRGSFYAFYEKVPVLLLEAPEPSEMRLKFGPYLS